MNSCLSHAEGEARQSTAAGGEPAFGLGICPQTLTLESDKYRMFRPPCGRFLQQTDSCNLWLVLNRKPTFAMHARSVQLQTYNFLEVAVSSTSTDIPTRRPMMPFAGGRRPKSMSSTSLRPRAEQTFSVRCSPWQTFGLHGPFPRHPIYRSSRNHGTRTQNTLIVRSLS